MSNAKSSISERLLSLANPEGGWSYYPGQASSVEPTCLSLLALNLPNDNEVAAKAIQFLSQAILPGGTVCQPGGRLEAVWPTALVLYSFQKLGLDSTLAPSMCGALLKIKGMTTTNPKAMEIHGRGIDLTKEGWPWTIGAFSWVEPTSWAVLALMSAGLADHPRCVQGASFLSDRILENGGANYGNKVVLGKHLDPVPIPTALTLVGLQNTPISDPIRKSIHYLASILANPDDLQNVAWSLLALDLYDRRDVDSPVVERARKWLHDSLVKLEEGAAISSLALGIMVEGLSGGNPFRVPENVMKIRIGKAWGPSEGLMDRIKGSFRRWMLAGLGGVGTKSPESLVAVERRGGYQEDLSGAVKSLYANFREKVPLKDKKVFLKPNMVEINPARPIHTNPAVVEAMIQLCIEEGAREILVGEGSGHRRNMEAVVEQSGLKSILKKYGVRFVDLNHDEVVSVANLGFHTGLNRIFFSKQALIADVLVSVPKLKTHHWATVTLSLKNLFGIASGQAYGWPKNELHFQGIDNSIADINSCRKADLVLVDGITGMEGDGPLYGDSVASGALVMGMDPVAVDATCARWMGFDPKKIMHMVKCAGSGLGNLEVEKIKVVGESLEMLIGRKFVAPPGEFAT